MLCSVQRTKICSASPICVQIERCIPCGSWAVSKRLRCAVTVQVGFSHQDALQEALVNNMVEGHVKRRDNSFHNQRFVAKSTEGKYCTSFLKLVESSIEGTHFSSVAQAHSVGS